MINPEERSNVVDMLYRLSHTDKQYIQETVDHLKKLENSVVTDEQKIMAYFGLAFLTDDKNLLSKIYSYMIDYDRTLIASCCLDVLAIIRELNIADCEKAIIDKIILMQAK